MVSRRQFLKTVLAAGTGLYLRSPLAAALNELPSALLPKPSAKTMLTRIIPSTGERIPAMGLGTWKSFYGPTTEEDQAALKKVLEIFFQSGGRLVDTAPKYGRAEELIGRMTGELGLKKKMFIATKVWAETREDGIRQMESSVTKLGVKQIDLMQIHSLTGWKTQIQTLKEWKAQKKFRYIGVTASSLKPDVFATLEQVMKTEKIDFVQQLYSIAKRQSEKRLLPLAQDKGIAYLVNLPFDEGALFQKVKGKPVPAWAKDFDCASWAQFFLKFILSHPAVTCIIPATGKPDHIVDNMKAGLGRVPSYQERLKMASYFQTL